MIKDGGILTSLDAKSGEVLKRGRIKGAAEPFYPSPVISDGRIYLAANSGKVAVVSAEADWELLSLSDLDERIDASPAIAEGALRFITGYIWNIKERNADEFVSMAEAAGVDKESGVWKSVDVQPYCKHPSDDDRRCGAESR